MAQVDTKQIDDPKMKKKIADLYALGHDLMRLSDKVKKLVV